MKKIALTVVILLLLISCSHSAANDKEIKTLQNKCAEYETQKTQLQKENKALRRERDSLNNVVENVKNWLYND